MTIPDSSPAFRHAWIITNPAARQGRAHFDAQQLEAPGVRKSRLFNATQWKVLHPSRAGDIERIVREAAEEGAQAVFAAGGDGTVHLVANALMRLEAGRRPVLGVLPGGTGNDFAKMIGLKRRTSEPLAALGNGRVEPVDVARCGEAFFINDFGAGLFSEATRAYHALPRFIPGRTRYVAAALRAIARPWDCRVVLHVDGVMRHDGPFAFAAVSNGAWSGGRFLMNPRGAIDDGLLDVWLCKPLGRGQLLLNLPRLFKGSHAGHSAIAHWRARRITIESRELPIYQMDGEIRDFPAPKLEIAVLPGALHVLACTRNRPPADRTDKQDGQVK